MYYGGTLSYLSPHRFIYIAGRSCCLKICTQFRAFRTTPMSESVSCCDPVRGRFFSVDTPPTSASSFLENR